MCELGRLLEQQIVVTTAALQQPLLEALLREAGAKAVVCRCESSRDAVMDAAAAADFFTAFYADLYRGGCVSEVRLACLLLLFCGINDCSVRPCARAAPKQRCTQCESRCNACRRCAMREHRWRLWQMPSAACTCWETQSLQRAETLQRYNIFSLARFWNGMHLKRMIVNVGLLQPRACKQLQCLSPHHAQCTSASRRMAVTPVLRSSRC